MYRPLGMAITRIASPFIQSPAGWSAIVLCLHAVNAAAVGVLAYRLGQSARAAAMVALLFLWSPWSSEAYLWFSGLFDVGTAFGMLLATVALASPIRTWSTGIGLLAASVIGCAIAAGFKETGYIAPVLVTLLAMGRDRGVSWKRIGLTCAACILCSASIYIYRSGTLAGTATPYATSEFMSLLATPKVLPSAAAHVRALFLWPVPEVWGDAGRMLATFWIWPVGGATLLVSLLSAARGGRRAWPLVVGLGISLGPTAFYYLTVQTITPRRYLYLAGIPMCLLVGKALDGMERPVAPRLTAMAHVVPAVLIMSMACALSLQVRLWRLASQTARCAVESFGERVLTQDGPQYVDNMPFAVDRGPLILLEYDFQYHYQQRWQATDVVYRRVVMAPDAGGGLKIDGLAEPPAGSQSMRVVSLDLCEGRSR